MKARLAARLAVVTVSAAALTAPVAANATTGSVPVKSVAFCKAGKVLLIDLKSADTTNRAGADKLLRHLHKDLAKLTAHAPSKAVKKHIKTEGKTLDKVMSLAVSVPAGAEPTAAQKSALTDAVEAFYSASLKLGFDLGLAGCGPYLKGLLPKA